MYLGMYLLVGRDADDQVFELCARLPHGFTIVSLAARVSRATKVARSMLSL